MNTRMVTRKRYSKEFKLDAGKHQESEAYSKIVVVVLDAGKDLFREENSKLAECVPQGILARKVAKFG